MLFASFWSRSWRLVLRASSFACAIVFLSVLFGCYVFYCSGVVSACQIVGVCFCCVFVVWWGLFLVCVFGFSSSYFDGLLCLFREYKRV